MPEIMFISVVLPLPFSPSIASISPLRTDRLILSLATTLPNRLEMFRSSMAFASFTRFPSLVCKHVHLLYHALLMFTCDGVIIV